jgi:hypothetical protein
MPASPPAVRTFVAGEVETAAYLNALGTAVAFVMNPPHGKMWATSVSPSMAAATNTTVTQGGASVTVGFTYAANVLTVPTTGVYLVTAQVRFAMPASSFAKTILLLNGTILAQSIVNNTGAGTANSTQSVSLLQSLNPGDTLTLQGYSSVAGATMYGDATGSDTFVYAQWCSAA